MCVSKCARVSKFHQTHKSGVLVKSVSGRPSVVTVFVKGSKCQQKGKAAAAANTHIHIRGTYSHRDGLGRQSLDGMEQGVLSPGNRL